MHLHGAGIDRRQRIGDRQFAVVVAVNADWHFGRFQHLRGRTRRSATFSGSVPPLVSHRMTSFAPASAAARIVLAAYSGFACTAVEEMLGVVKHFASAAGQKRDRLADHVEVFFQRDAEDLGDMKIPGLADDRDDGRLGRDEGLNRRSSTSRF